MRNTILNTSKEFITFSDFPLDKRMANFPHNREVYEYLQSYAAHFHLKRHIQFGTRVTEVSLRSSLPPSPFPKYIFCSRRTSSKCREHVTENIQIRKAEDYEETGNWLVTTERGTTVFNAVMICNGHHVRPYSPQISGLEIFRGTVTHSHDYKVALLSVRHNCSGSPSLS